MEFWRISIVYVILVTLAIVFLTLTNGDEIPNRRKRWSTTLLAKPVEQHECKSDSDCSQIPYTSCAMDQRDKKQRCLCADYAQPVNGECRKLPKELRTPCNDDIECLPGAECVHETFESTRKLCFCRQEYSEVNNTCTNGCGMMTAVPVVLLITVGFTLYRNV